MGREDSGENRRKHFDSTISLGSIIAIIAILGSAAGLFAQNQSDVRVQEQRIQQIEKREIDKKKEDKEQRQELKEDIKEVKSEVKEVRQDLQKILQEIRSQSRR